MLERRTLLNVSVDDISPNPNNPRLHYYGRGFEELKKSIAKVGILVPLTLYENTKKVPKTKYILLDGERRWRCAKELGLESVPANVIDEPEDVTQNILFMFNIHHFREKWALFPTALKLEVIMKKLETDQESVLSEFTGVDRSIIRRCKKLLWYPKEFRSMLMEKGGKISTDFFIELYPIAFRLSAEEEFSYPEGTSRLVRKMIDKFLSGDILTDVKEFREIRKSMAYYDDKNNFEEFQRRLTEFISASNISLETFASPDIESEKARKNVLKFVGYLSANLKELNPELISDVYLVEQLRNLCCIITNVLEQIE